jgi:RHS repeat-associated protein
MKVAVEGGVVKYYRNSTLVYTSTVAPAYPLKVDTSLNTVGASVYNVVISGARLTASPINYVLQDVQGSTRAVMSGTSVIARHDFLPFGEEIGVGTGMRTTGQGYGAVDKIRQRYGLTERDDSTGLDHTWWRKYENFSGRWTSPDPYLGSMTIANPQSFNRFAYVQNDPVNFLDPTGLVKCWDVVKKEWFECGPPNPDTVTIDHWEMGSLFGDYFIPASRSGRSPMFFGLMSAPIIENVPQNTDSGQNSSDDPCDSGKYASELQGDLGQIAHTIGGTLDANWNIHGPRRLTVDTAIGRLESAGFVKFYSYNSEHPGVNLQGQLNGRWYHVTVSPFSSPNAAVNANRSPSGPNNATTPPGNRLSSRVNKVTAHCEKNKPDSAAHFWDYVRIWF